MTYIDLCVGSLGKRKLGTKQVAPGRKSLSIVSFSLSSVESVCANLSLTVKIVPSVLHERFALWMTMNRHYTAYH